LQVLIFYFKTLNLRFTTAVVRIVIICVAFMYYIQRKRPKLAATIKLL
jgi:hypothetical protein